MFSCLFNIFWQLDPGAFTFPERAAPGVSGPRAPDLLHFSLVTIASLGYGDIVPRSDLARMAATVEAVLGQFYVAVVIAWLVSLHAGRPRNEKRELMRRTFRPAVRRLRNLSARCPFETAGETT